MNSSKTVAVTAALTLFSGSPGAADPDQAAKQLETVEIIADSPLMVSGMPVDKIPAPVQTVSAKDLDSHQSLSVADYIRWKLGSVTVNDAQNNPFQPDVQFRGFTASPLLGLPQGMSVYVNGIRFNEPFGDTVNWDLIPENAVEQMTLHSGSNPVYGLNTLGGAIAMRTKTGFSAPGHTIELAGGSWGRHWQELSSGWNNGSIGYFVDLKSFMEDGWRDFSPTDVKQGFGTFSWQDERSRLNLTLSANNNTMIGNGALPYQLYRQDYQAIFTHPDRTTNRLFLAALDGSSWLTDNLELSGNVYFRQNRVKTFNGDDSDFERCDDGTGLLCDEDGAQVDDINGNAIPAPNAQHLATNNTSYTRQRSFGGSLQSAWEQDFAGMHNRLVTGGSFDEGIIHFGSDTEVATLTADRGTVGTGWLVGESRVRVHGHVRHHGLYFSDSLAVTEQLTLTAAGRYNLSFVRLDDRYGTDLNGFHKFERFNPSAGLTYAFLPEIGFYGNYSESNRAPTPVELTCSNPEAPCKLPNAFLSDPPLNQVVAKTWEAGLRGKLTQFLNAKIDWNAGLFQTENHDDILFITSGRLTNQGYFDNVGITRRRGIELGLTSEWDRARFGVNYTLLDATFRTPFLANSPNNPAADEEGRIRIQRGDRLPGVPRHQIKVYADVEVVQGLTLGANMIFNSGQFFRGDEANVSQPLKEYALFNLHGEYRFNPHVALFARIDNLFDKRYNTFGLYGDANDVLPGYTDTRFVGVGAPRAGWVGVKLSL